MKRKWEKRFLWDSTKRLPNGKLMVEVAEVERVVENLRVLGNRMALQMMTQMIKGVREKEFCDSQNNWNRYLFDRAMPSAHGIPAPMTFEPKNPTSSQQGGRSYGTGSPGQKPKLKKETSKKCTSASRLTKRKT